ncbi:universal stress protein [Halobacteriales archaeon QS_8_69_26]|nr:MAG: universal stress protein [Halobacteriales archaeon QS_8_69_26]
MALLVPFDGSDLSTAALERAVEFGEFTGEEVVVPSVVPPSEEYARERGWIAPDEPFDPDLVAGRLRDRAEAVAPGATHRTEVPEDVSATASLTTDVVRTIHEVAAEVGASVLSVGSANAGRVSTPLSSVGTPVSEDPRYDVHIVRHA